MCEAGRILHHLRNGIEDPRNTVLITGFQAQDTLGRKLVEKCASNCGRFGSIRKSEVVDLVGVAVISNRTRCRLEIRV